MPKYMSRVKFETMKELRKYKNSIKDIAKAVESSPATVSRNLHYNSYADYLAAMYGRASKSQKEIEAKSGPVTVTKKVCSKCSETKPLEEFDKDKNGKNGTKSFCKECRREMQRKYKKVKTNTNKPSTTAEPDVKTRLDWLFKLTDEHDRRLKRIEDELDEKFHSDEPVEEEQPDEQGLEPRVGEVLNVFVEGKIRRAEIMGSREVAEFGHHEKRYLVRYKKLFGFKHADVSEAVLYTD